MYFVKQCYGCNNKLSPNWINIAVLLKPLYVMDEYLSGDLLSCIDVFENKLISESLTDSEKAIVLANIAQAEYGKCSTNIYYNTFMKLSIAIHF